MSISTGSLVNPDISDWVIKDAMNHDDDGNVVEEEPEKETDENTDKSDELESKETDEKELEVEPDKDEPLTVDKVTDETEFDVDGQKVPMSELRKAFVDRRDQQADYTRKTQVLSAERGEFEAEQREYESAWDKRGKDAREMLTYLKRRYPDTLHQMAVLYGTEYSELQELAKENPAEYHRIVREERERLDAITNEEKNRLGHRKEVQRVRNLLQNFVGPSLEQANLLPKRRSQSYEKFIFAEFQSAYLDYIKSRPHEQMTKEVIEKIAKSLKDNKTVKEELEINEERYKAKDGKATDKKEPKPKPKPKLNKVNQGKPTRKETQESLTHENFFDKVV